MGKCNDAPNWRLEIALIGKYGRLNTKNHLLSMLEKTWEERGPPACRDSPMIWSSSSLFWLFFSVSAPPPSITSRPNWTQVSGGGGGHIASEVQFHDFAPSTKKRWRVSCRGTFVMSLSSLVEIHAGCTDEQNWWIWLWKKHTKQQMYVNFRIPVSLEMLKHCRENHKIPD